MPLAKQLFRLIRATGHIGNAMVRVAVLFPWISTSARRRQTANWSRKSLRIFGISITKRGSLPEGDVARLLVANHVSWLDVFAIWSQSDTVFVAKGEVAHWPLIGPLARRLGVVFIDRSSRRAAQTVTHVISNLLAEGQSVCIFPEGTSTDGRAIQAFHPALFQSAVDAGVAIQPISIQYIRSDGSVATEAAFTGNMSLAQSMWRLASADEITVQIACLSPVNPGGLDRRVLSDQTHALINRHQQQATPGWALQTDESSTLFEQLSVVHSFDAVAR
jgi:1-acyl-sn-glycerol-3-phosphate acyltransferase